MGKRKGPYVRASNGKFAKTAGGGKKTSTAKKKTNALKKSVKNRATSIGSKKLRKKLSVGSNRLIGQAGVRKARNQAGLDSLRKKGVAIPKGSIQRVKKLKKGQSVKLSNGTVIRRTSNNGYTATKPKKKKGKK